jgi:(2R)-phospho-3-sulfolactate synthase (ComA)
MIESEGITECVDVRRTDVVTSIVSELGVEHVMFEAADPDVFASGCCCWARSWPGMAASASTNGPRPPMSRARENTSRRIGHALPASSREFAARGHRRAGRTGTHRRTCGGRCCRALRRPSPRRPRSSSRRHNTRLAHLAVRRRARRAAPRRIKQPESPDYSELSVGVGAARLRCL